MYEAVGDTGPILHLYEINHLGLLSIFSHLVLPLSVVEELRIYGLNLADLTDVRVSVMPVDQAHRDAMLVTEQSPAIHSADAEVFLLAYGNSSRLMLTDDLVLRRRLEANGIVVVGSVGILVRAYKTGRLTRSELEMAIDTLFTVSTLYLSRAFCVYVRQLLSELP